MPKKYSDFSRISCTDTLWGGKIKLTYGFDLSGNPIKKPMTEKQACSECKRDYHKEFPKIEISKQLMSLFGNKKKAIQEIESISCCSKGCGNCLYIVHTPQSRPRFSEYGIDLPSGVSFIIGSAYYDG